MDSEHRRRSDAVRQAFLFSEVGILVRHWFEIDLDDSHLEHGARVEVRLLTDQPRRGTESAAQRIVLDQPVWRADLFDRLDGTHGAFEAAHFHPYFEGVEPCKRHWSDQVRTAPWDWLADQLSDLAGIVTLAGRELRDPATESEQVRTASAEIVEAARRRAPTECRSKWQCHAWTRDAVTAVHVMLDRLATPNLLDRDRAARGLPAR
jgi:hypothetical protein